MNFKVYYTTAKMGETTIEVDNFSADSHIFKEGVVLFFNHKDTGATPIMIYSLLNLVKIEVVQPEKKVS